MKTNMFEIYYCVPYDETVWGTSVAEPISMSNPQIFELSVRVIDSQRTMKETKAR